MSAPHNTRNETGIGSILHPVNHQFQQRYSHGVVAYARWKDNSDDFNTKQHLVLCICSRGEAVVIDTHPSATQVFEKMIMPSPSILKACNGIVHRAYILSVDYSNNKYDFVYEYSPYGVPYAVNVLYVRHTYDPNQNYFESHEENPPGPQTVAHIGREIHRRNMAPHKTRGSEWVIPLPASSFSEVSKVLMFRGEYITCWSLPAMADAYRAPIKVFTIHLWEVRRIAFSPSVDKFKTRVIRNSNAGGCVDLESTPPRLFVGYEHCIMVYNVSSGAYIHRIDNLLMDPARDEFMIGCNHVSKANVVLALSSRGNVYAMDATNPLALPGDHIPYPPIKCVLPFKLNVIPSRSTCFYDYNSRLVLHDPKTAPRISHTLLPDILKDRTKKQNSYENRYACNWFNLTSENALLLNGSQFFVINIPQRSFVDVVSDTPLQTLTVVPSARYVCVSAYAVSKSSTSGYIGCILPSISETYNPRTTILHDRCVLHLTIIQTMFRHSPIHSSITTFEQYDFSTRRMNPPPYVVSGLDHLSFTKLVSRIFEISKSHVDFKVFMHNNHAENRKLLQTPTKDNLLMFMDRWNVWSATRIPIELDPVSANTELNAIFDGMKQIVNDIDDASPQRTTNELNALLLELATKFDPLFVVE